MPPFDGFRQYELRATGAMLASGRRRFNSSDRMFPTLRMGVGIHPLYGSQRHSSDADQAQLVQPLECRRRVDARAFDLDDAGLLEARDRRIDVSRRPILERSVHTVSLAAANPPHNLQDNQIFCALHWSEAVSYLLAAVAVAVAEASSLDFQP